MIPTKELSQHKLVVRLRALVDRMADPCYRITNPEGFAMDYHLLVVLATRHRKQLESSHVTHNLGERRVKILKQVLQQADQEHVWGEVTV